ncbi:MAG: hypothetical protein AUJ12_07850 [Alphaproteobacteria bacterium CG1_02_46_17]|nr:MAG: hypothetical protein AUJ12_07850 [Alphaproteobacteria bacterium CG1_02_46_17]
MKKILVLGANGMLGAMLTRWFSSNPNFSVTATTRNGQSSEALRAFLPSGQDVEFIPLNADTTTAKELATILGNYDFAINAIGRIKQKIRDKNLEDYESTLRANALFSIILGQATEQSGTKVIQIATDCVYTGVDGQYNEDHLHDANDIYGRSKSAGEVISKNQINLRCSVIGPELNSSYSLLSWFLSNKQGSTLNGFSNHIWNGVTSLHFAKICQGVIENPMSLDFVPHIVPSNTISKLDLLRAFQKNFNRQDISITEKQATEAIDRTLTTNHPDLNIELWRNAGHDAPPTIESMVEELATYIGQK